ncbi:MAG: hypothetical protein MUE99_07150 [Chitinophagaceae bacterium]|nr:hypothetical protein [Chitinophagaceae bacterium]
MKPLQQWIWVCISLAVFSACNKPFVDELNKVELQINVTHRMAGNLLTLNDPTTTPFGEPVTISNFQYYLSRIELINAGGNIVRLPVEYYLISERNEASKSVNLRVPAGTYRGIRMLLGVDSTRNVSGVQEGALDPANGMFWSWNTGYIFAKLEGKSPVSTAPLQNVTYHIGGFKAAESALQTIEMPFPTLTPFSASDTAYVEVSVNLDKWFDGPFPLRIADEPFVMNAGNMAQQISVNYSRMFSITSVSN